MNRSKRLRFISIPIVGALASAGLILTAAPSYAAPTHLITNAKSGTCLTNNSSGQSVLGPCSGAAATWHIRAQISLNGQTYNQWENGNSKCLGLAGSTGPQLVIGGCSPTSDHSQFWHGPGTNVFTQVTNGHTGFCAGTKGSATGNGTLVIEGACNSGSVSQMWAAV